MLSDTLKKIRDFADEAHGSQLRKYSGERYINHPLRVMETVRQHRDDLPLLAAALLHDVLEDTETTRQEIMSFLNSVVDGSQAQKTMQLVEELTDVYEKKHYPQWNRKKRKQMETERLAKVSGDAQTVKYADILDDSQDILANDPGFGKRYAWECLGMLSVMKEGDAALRQKALEAVKLSKP